MLGPIGPYPYADDYETAYALAKYYRFVLDREADANYEPPEGWSDDSTDLQWRRGDAEDWTDE